MCVCVWGERDSKRKELNREIERTGCSVCVCEEERINRGRKKERETDRQIDRHSHTILTDNKE